MCIYHIFIHKAIDEHLCLYYSLVVVSNSVLICSVPKSLIGLRHNDVGGKKSPVTGCHDYKGYIVTINTRGVVSVIPARFHFCLTPSGLLMFLPPVFLMSWNQRGFLRWASECIHWKEALDSFFFPCRNHVFIRIISLLHYAIVEKGGQPFRIRLWL